MKYILVILDIGYCSCSSPRTKAPLRVDGAGPASNKVKAVRTDSLDILSRQWKNDSLGCEPIRGIDALGEIKYY